MLVKKMEGYVHYCVLLRVFVDQLLQATYAGSDPRGVILPLVLTAWLPVKKNVFRSSQTYWKSTMACRTAAINTPLMGSINSTQDPNTKLH